MVFSQEICDNAIDDDGDGLIDLNDEECVCDNLDYIPNPYFEEYDCCPGMFDLISCLPHWDFASLFSASEHLHTCAGDIGPAFPLFPLPSGGEGYVSFDGTLVGTFDPETGLFVWTFNPEDIATCLINPLVAGYTYSITFYTSILSPRLPTSMGLYGTDDCANIGIAPEYCLSDSPAWTELGISTVDYIDLGSWYLNTITFTPDADITALAFEPTCDIAELLRIYMDKVDITRIGDPLVTITSFGSWCTEDALLVAEVDLGVGDWQWYKDGIALIGEVDDTINIMEYGEGNYTAQNTQPDNCSSKEYLVTSPPVPTANFMLFDDTCSNGPLTIDLEDLSTTPSGEIISRNWRFSEDDDIIDLVDFERIYDAHGTYSIELSVENTFGCKDTITRTFTMHPIPSTYPEFIADGISSNDGSTGGCIYDSVFFDAHELIAPPSIITSVLWDFGDGSTSTETSLNHLYEEPGHYEVSIIVTSNSGCTVESELDIFMTDGLYDLSLDTTICIDGAAIISVTSFDDSPFIYDWSITDSEANTITIPSAEAPVMVYVSAINPAGCVSPIDSVFVNTYDSLNLDLIIPDSACIDETIYLEPIVSGGFGTYSYTWTKDGFFNAFSDELTFTVNETVEYCLEIEDVCETPPVEICQFIFVYQYPDFSSDKLEACVFDTITFENITLPDTSVLTAIWRINGENIEGNLIQYQFTEAGTYDISLRVFFPGDCEYSIIKNSYIKIHPLPEPLFYYLPEPVNILDPEVKLININPTPSSSLEWIIPAGEPSSVFSDSIASTTLPDNRLGSYEVLLIETTQHGCIDSTTQLIEVENIHLFYAPNAFTSDGNSFNDGWKVTIFGLDIYDFHLVIYNRWGQVIWESYDPHISWDGSYNNQIVESGVYVWKAIVKDGITDQKYNFEGIITVLK